MSSVVGEGKASGSKKAVLGNKYGAMKVQNTAVRLREREVSSVKANSTSTMFVTSTISVPDLDEIILSVSSVLQCQMFRCVTGMHDKHYGE